MNPIRKQIEASENELEKYIKTGGKYDEKLYLKMGATRVKNFLRSSQYHLLEKVLEEIEKMDVGGGGSGRRLQIQLSTLISNAIEK